ncbi:MAG: FKBP-type peptidyl-prolyl cis-trans isomerase [Bdellovibrionaceae bacterium]|jgi:FKBP-type peptidyl-prolyl cis-trans isomerase|nr:FKBP-type peptidyl-prolyl cis-trans isomerase [Pseudobdellovibrionaceae bacterium]
MKSINSALKVAAVVFVTTTLISCLPASDPKTDVQKVSYAIGQQIGKNLKAQEVDVDIKMMAQSIEEAREGKDSRMTREEMQEAMTNMQKMRMEKRKKDGEKNKTDGAAFLAKAATADGVTKLDSGLLYKVITKGSGPVPKATDTVKVHYKGTLTSGKEFDSSYKRNKPAEFPVNGVIKGWTEALLLMPVGSKWQLTIPADIAYGPSGRPGIPPNSVLLFDVELLEIVDAAAAGKKLDLQKHIKKAMDAQGKKPKK